MTTTQKKRYTSRKLGTIRNKPKKTKKRYPLLAIQNAIEDFWRNNTKPSITSIKNKGEDSQRDQHSKITS